MSRAQPKPSPTDQHARSIAAAIAKGRPPALTPELDHYLGSSPREIFVAFEGVARHMPPPGGNDETLALGYLFLLQQLLEHLRYRTDRGYADAASHAPSARSASVRLWRTDPGDRPPDGNGRVSKVCGGFH